MNLLRAGASGFVVKNESTENLLHAVRTVACGGTWYSQRIAQKLAEWACAAPAPLEQLTPQEARVLHLLARGKTDAEIMTELGIASRTLRHHVQTAMEKIGVQERTQAVLWALEQGFGEKRLREAQDSYVAGQE